MFVIFPPKPVAKLLQSFFYLTCDKKTGGGSDTRRPVGVNELRKRQPLQASKYIANSYGCGRSRVWLTSRFIL
jgi:hypothetical protein